MNWRSSHLSQEFWTADTFPNLFVPSSFDFTPITSTYFKTLAISYQEHIEQVYVLICESAFCSTNLTSFQKPLPFFPIKVMHHLIVQLQPYNLSFLIGGGSSKTMPTNLALDWVRSCTRVRQIGRCKTPAGLPGLRARIRHRRW